MKVFSRFFIQIPSLGAISVLLAGCGQSNEPYVIEEVREIDPNERIKIAATSAERFRSRTPQTNRDPGQPQLSWDTPEGWSEKPGTDMRLANFTFGEQNEGEVYVVRLQGGGGGLLANVNRWRGQMGLPPISEEDVASLPKKLLFGLEATYVSMDGTFTGMGTEPKENYRMLGLILSSDIGAVFVKMTGPRELVAENEEKFDEFCQSLGLGVPGQ